LYTRRKIFVDNSETRTEEMVGHMLELRYDSPLKVIEGQTEGKKTPGRPREMLLDWLNKENNMNYSQRKRTAKDSESAEWRQ